MTITQLKEKATPFIREARIFVQAEPTDVITAYADENHPIRFIVNHEGQWMGLAEHDDEFSFTPLDPETMDMKSYTLLTTRAIRIYPPFENLMHYGDEEIQDWIRENDGDKDDLCSLAAFASDEYTDLWMDNHPIYSPDGLFAYQGGWAMIWPEDDTPVQWDENLEFCYQIGLQNEPFIEIFYDKEHREFICLERNT